MGGACACAAGGISDDDAPALQDAEEVHVHEEVVLTAEEQAADVQQQLGPQSLRGGADRRPLEKLDGDEHALQAFETLLQREGEYCKDYVVFYHSYSHAALLYEVRAAVAKIRFDFDSKQSPLPRLCAEDFGCVPDAETLIQKVRTEWGAKKIDHKPEFRRVAISVMCSLLARGPECCLAVAFNEGYSCKQIAFRAVLEEELSRGLDLPASVASELFDKLLALAARHSLDASVIGGRSSPSGRAGHVLQIFMRRDLVDRLCYPALPYGEVDQDRLPLSAWLNSGSSFNWGQARILVHPDFFMDSERVRMFSVSADPSFDSGRHAFQEELVAALRAALPRTAPDGDPPACPEPAPSAAAGAGA